MAHAETTTERSGAAIVFVAPVVLVAGFALHPYIGLGLPNQSAVATAAAEHTTRWGLAHLAIGVSSGLLALAFLAIRVRLRQTGQECSSALGVPFIVLGSTLYALLPGMEFAPLAAAKAGADVEATAEALVPWLIPIQAIGALAFGFGVFAFRRGIAESGILSRGLSRLVVAALAVTAVSRFVPLSFVQFYVQSVAVTVALWPLAFEMWRAPVHAVGTHRGALAST
jgi:hypothetical protein